MRGPYTAFAEVAGAYERGRPGYPEDAVRWLVGSEPHDVVDLGAGTGKLTRSLVALGHRVTAVEPLEEMRAQLTVAVPGVTVIAGSAEAMPLPDASADVVPMPSSKAHRAAGDGTLGMLPTDSRVRASSDSIV